MAKTLIEALDAAAQEPSRGFTFLSSGLTPTEWSFAAIAREAERRARVLRSLGLEPGDRVALIIPEGEDFVLSFFGAVRAGLIPVPMYPPLALAEVGTYLDTAARIMTAAGVKSALTSRPVARLLGTLLERVPSLEQLDLVEALAGRHPEAEHLSLEDVQPAPEELCFLQFTSGSTASPKGVCVSHQNLIENAAAIMQDGLQCKPEQDVGVSWLPLYHDMGLIGFVIAPLVAQVPVVFIPTLRFMKGPAVWMDTISRYKGTISFAPNFAFSLATRRASAARLEKLDLSSLRVLGCGAEPINPAVMRDFCAAFAPAGLRPEVILPAYGMAEATLAVSFDRRAVPVQSLRIDRGRYEREHVAAPPTEGAEALELTCVGTAIGAHRLQIQGPDGAPAAEGQVGEVLFSGPSVTAGYYADAAATADRFQAEWLHTGDLGFMLDGQLYISGRKKDLIILNGRNYDPQSIEWGVEQLPGLRPGNVVAFSTRGEATETLVLVAEHRAATRDLNTLEAELRARLSGLVGANAAKVLLVPPGALPKTSSGKVQRQKTKAMYEAGQLDRPRILRGREIARSELARQLSLSAMARLKHQLANPRKAARRAKAQTRWIAG